MAFTTVVAQEASAKASIPSPRPGPIEENTQTKMVVEFTPIPAEAPAPQKGVTPADASQTESSSPITPHVICTSDPFTAFSQAIKDDSSLVVTPSSIPSSATCGPCVDLSSDEGSKEVLENSKDEPVMKKRVSDSNQDDGGQHETETMGMCLLPLLDLFFCLIIYIYIYIYI